MYAFLQSPGGVMETKKSVYVHVLVIHLLKLIIRFSIIY